ncbi:efflux transporter outer membrane subunit [Pseudolabrys sp. FHR47]|uniref:efflux transporter outer membrane subunit n=1 Tax=Pseudolabrys sp. FHR47 TaxID=2562284 RepID=UPI001FF0258F|nr:efflux transporter outer membrane subunit [Pseudolabrys sp. FHR47]
MSARFGLETARPFGRILLAASIAVTLGGCLLSDKPEPGLDIPARYSGSSANPKIAEAALPKLDWWRGFRSRELTEIVEQSLEANLDIAAAIARIVQADAQSRISGAPLLPSVSLSSDASRSRSSRSVTPTARDTNSLSASLTASYELDFWGKNRASLRSAEQSAVAARYDREVVALSTVASAANAYFQVLAAQDRLAAARNNLASANRVLDLIKQRVTAGTASDLELAQQESTVYTQRATIPPLLQTVTENKNTLALLMARSPESVRIRGGSLRAIAMPRVTPGLPSELLAQRPDIRYAEANLAAANANVEVARANMLPSISLTAEGGVQSAVFKTLLKPESTLYSLGAGLTQPIFDGGTLQGTLDLKKGAQDELLQSYRKAVISGFSDVETALDAVRQTAQAERVQAEVVSSSQRAFDISERRLREGTVDMVTVLQTQQTLFSAQDTLVQKRLASVQAIVSLYQALGGGWAPKPQIAEAPDAR